MKRATVVLYWGGERTVFQPVLGRPLGAYALDAVRGLRPDAIVVLDGGGERERWEDLIARVDPGRPVFLLAAKTAKGGRRGNTLAALLAARDVLEKYPDCDVLIVPADVPLVRETTLKALLRPHTARRQALTFLGVGGQSGISDILAVRSGDAFPHLRGISPALGMAGFEVLARRLVRAGRRIGFHECGDEEETVAASGAPGVSRAAARLRERKNDALARGGVVFLDPASAWIDWDVRIGPRTVVYPSVVVEGPTRIGADGAIYPHVHIMASTIGARVKVLTSTVMEDTVLENDVQVGPFSRFRPKTRVRAGAKVGNFVEMKNTDFGPGSKAQHLSYVGDSTVGEGVNVGAGTITCNYDGVAKNPTRIEAGVCIGSGTGLVAPVTVGRGAYIAAGSTITQDVAAGALAIARARQVEKPGWARERARARAKPRGGGRP